MASLQVGEAGLKLILNTGIDLTPYSTFEILAHKPNRVIQTWPATIEGAATGGQIAYTTVAGDLDVPGKWKLQAKVATGAIVLYGDAAEVRVKELGQL